VVVTHVPGWFLTALAISLGAPFWFDVLDKFMVIRGTVKPQEKSPGAARAGAAIHEHGWAHGNPREGVL